MPAEDAFDIGVEQLTVEPDTPCCSEHWLFKEDIEVSDDLRLPRRDEADGEWGADPDSAQPL